MASLMQLALLSFVLGLLRRSDRFGGLWQARWLLLTIFVLYAGFTPGEPILAQLPGLSREGALEAARRMLVLIVLIQAVGLLIKTVSVENLTAAIALLLRPLRIVGFNHQRFARRLGLTLQQIDGLRDRLQQLRDQHADSWTNAVAQLVREIESGEPQARIAP